MFNKKFYIVLFLFICAPVVADENVNVSTVTVQDNKQIITLEKYQDMAIANNQELHKIQFESEYAHQESKAAFTKYFPKISASGAIANTGILPGLTTPISILPLTYQSNGASVVMLNATQPLFTGGRIINGNKLAITSAKASDYKLQIKRNEIYAEAEKKYRQFQLLEDKKETVMSYEKMLDSLYSQVSQAFELGISSKSDFLRTKLKKEEISVQKSQLNKMLEIAKKD
jgi:outer membrane protein TolC